MKRVYIIVAVAVVIIIIVVRYYKNEEFSSTNNKIIENYPTAPQNVLVADVNGNLSVSNDLGLQHLTIAGNAQLENLSVKNRNIIDVLDSLTKQIDATITRIESINTASTTAAAANKVIVSKMYATGLM